MPFRLLLCSGAFTLSDVETLPTVSVFQFSQIKFQHGVIIRLGTTMAGLYCRRRQIIQKLLCVLQTQAIKSQPPLCTPNSGYPPSNHFNTIFIRSPGMRQKVRLLDIINKTCIFPTMQSSDNTFVRDGRLHSILLHVLCAVSTEKMVFEQKCRATLPRLLSQ